MTTPPTNTHDSHAQSQTVSTADARTKLPDLIAFAQGGGRVHITSYNKPVATLTAYTPEAPASADALLALIDEHRDDMTAAVVACWRRNLRNPADVRTVVTDPNYYFEIIDYLPRRPMTLDEVIAWARLEPPNAKLLDDAGEDVLAWAAVVDEINDILFATEEFEAVGDEDRHYLAYSDDLIGGALRAGLTPTGLVDRVRELIAAGVGGSSLGLAMDDVVPQDLLRKYGDRVPELLRGYAAAGVDRETAEELLRAAVPSHSFRQWRAAAGVTDPKQIIALRNADVSPLVVARAVTENIPAEEWPELLRGLPDSWGAESHRRYGTAPREATEDPEYRLPEVAFTLREVRHATDLGLDLTPWNKDRFAPHRDDLLASLTLDQIIDLHQQGIDHDYVRNVATFISKTNWGDDDGGVRRVWLVDNPVAVIKRLHAAGPVWLSNAGWLVATAERGTVDELISLGVYPVSRHEAEYLVGIRNRSMSVAEIAARLEKFAEAVPEMEELGKLRNMPGIKEALAMLPKPGKWNGRNPLRTEALKWATGKSSQWKLVSICHIVMLYRALNATPWSTGSPTQATWAAEMTIKHPEFEVFWEALRGLYGKYNSFVGPLRQLP